MLHLQVAAWPQAVMKMQVIYYTKRLTVFWINVLLNLY